MIPSRITKDGLPLSDFVWILPAGSVRRLSRLPHHSPFMRNVDSDSLQFSKLCSSKCQSQEKLTGAVHSTEQEKLVLLNCWHVRSMVHSSVERGWGGLHESETRKEERINRVAVWRFRSEVECKTMGIPVLWLPSDLGCRRVWFMSGPLCCWATLKLNHRLRFRIPTSGKLWISTPPGTLLHSTMLCEDLTHAHRQSTCLATLGPSPAQCCRVYYTQLCITVCVSRLWLLYMRTGLWANTRQYCIVFCFDIRNIILADIIVCQQTVLALFAVLNHCLVLVYGSVSHIVQGVRHK